MRLIFSRHTVKSFRLLLLALALASAPAQAQWYGAPSVPAPPAAPLPPVPAADLALWLKNAQQAADTAREAQKKHDPAKRNAAILEAVQWGDKVANPHNVPNASRRDALEIVGLLARDMNTWGVTFEEVKVGTQLVMLDVRGKAMLDNAPNAQKTAIQMHLGEIGAAQGYSYIAFENFSAIAQNPNAEIALVKRAAARAIPYIPRNDRRSARPIYDRMLALPLSPEEQSRWQNLRAMHILQTEYQGEEREAALALIKKQVFDDATPAATREELARALEDTVFDEEAEQLYEAMLARPNLSAPDKAHWFHLRGERRVADKKYAEAAADYAQAAQVAPADSLQRDEALWNNAWVRLTHLNAKGDVPAALAPTLENLIVSPRLPKEKRFAISSHLLAHYLKTKDYTKAQKMVTLRKELAGTNLPRQVEADMEMVQVHIGQNQLEAAVALWTAQPYDSLMGFKPDWGSAKYQASGKLLQQGMALYKTLILAKQFELAQKILDDPDSTKIFRPGDYQLLRADYAVQKGDYGTALTVLRALLDKVQTPQEKATVNAYIAGVEKRQAEAGP